MKELTSRFVGFHQRMYHKHAIQVSMNKEGIRILTFVGIRDWLTNSQLSWRCNGAAGSQINAQEWSPTFNTCARWKGVNMSQRLE
jgi:hypothetical protein